MDNSFFPLANYHILETILHSSAKGGGVGIYIKNHLAYNVLKQYSVFIERILESLFVEISLPNNKNCSRICTVHISAGYKISWSHFYVAV